MKTLITKTKTALSKVALFATSIFLLGWGLAFVGTIALFGLVAMGVAMIASLFIPHLMEAKSDTETVA